MKSFFRLMVWLTLVNVFGAAGQTPSKSVAAPSAPLPRVEKVEPPDWWANHTISTVRVLVRGANFRGARVVSKNDSLVASNVLVNAPGDYLFFDVAIGKNTRPGKYDFEVSTDSGKAVVPFEIRAPLARKTDFQTVTGDDVIYLIMPDRFADGDPSNNADVNRQNPRAWHGGDFRGIAERLPYLKELGVTVIWLTPWYDNPDQANECDKPWCPNTNYHGYHAIDHYAVENHFGTFEDLRRMIAAAHRAQIKVVQDQVANHVGVQHPWVKSAPLENWFSAYAPNSFNNSVLLSPNASRAEKDSLLKGWFNELLPDLNQTEPEVARYEIQNALWWIGATGIDGVRQDTIQYMPREFIRDWSAAILKQYPNFYLVGEVFEEDSVQTAFFQGGRAGWDGIDTRLPSVFDFKLWRTSQEVFTGKKPLRALRDVLKYDGLYPNVNRVTVLANNHDTVRFMSLPGATKDAAKLHTAFILATRGIPQLYYGEEILMTGGHDPDNRRDFPGGFAGDPKNKFTRAGRTIDEQEMFEWTRAWIKLRRENRALSEGQTVDIFYDNDAYVFGRKFVGERNGQTVVVGFNFSDSTKEINFSTYNNNISPNAEKVVTLGGGTKMLVGEYIKNYLGNNDDHKMMIPPKSVIAFSIEKVF